MRHSVRFRQHNIGRVNGEAGAWPENGPFGSRRAICRRH